MRATLGRYLYTTTLQHYSPQKYPCSQHAAGGLPSSSIHPSTHPSSLSTLLITLPITLLRRLSRIRQGCLHMYRFRLGTCTCIIAYCLLLMPVPRLPAWLAHLLKPRHLRAYPPTTKLHALNLHYCTSTSMGWQRNTIAYLGDS